MYKQLLTLLLSVFLVTACNGIVETEPPFSEHEIDLLKSKFEAQQLQVLLAGLQTADQDKLEAYKSSLKAIGDTVAADWQADPAKLMIDSYIKTDGLKEEIITYSYQNNQILVSEGAPQHIQDSFNKTFVCYSADYWNQFDYELEKSIGFSWDTLDAKMLIRVTQIK